MRSRVALSIVLAVMAAALLRAQSVSTHTASVSKPAKPSAASAKADPLAPYEHWITGEILSGNSLLLFRVDRPVKGNPRGNIVVLGLTSDTAKVLGLMYMRAAELHKQVRLFGAFIPYAGKTKAHSELLPNVEFITWKMHAPSDPGVLPPGQRIDIDGGVTTIGNVPVQLIGPDGRPLGSGDTITIHRAGGTSTNPNSGSSTKP